MMAGAALVLGVFAAAAGTPYPSGVDADARASASSVGAVQLAEWIRDRRAGLQVLDLRTPDAFAQFNIPTSANIHLAELGVAGLDSTGLVVVYADGDDKAGRAETILHALGFDSVRVLHDGSDGWVSDILNPMVARDASAAERAAFDRVAPLSRYFGGMPRVVDRVDIVESASTTLARTLRRGCAF